MQSTPQAVEGKAVQVEFASMTIHKVRWHHYSSQDCTITGSDFFGTDGLMKRFLQQSHLEFSFSKAVIQNLSHLCTKNNHGNNFC